MSQTVWITGGGDGIGRALALRLCNDGATVAISGRRDLALAEVVADAADRAGTVVAFPLDVTDRTAVAKTAEDIEKQIGSLDLVVFNAGTHQAMGACDFSAEVFEALFRVNVMGAVHGIETMLPRFRVRGNGHIAVVSSVAGYQGLPSAAAYGATKAALINMCEALKPELDAAGIGLSMINPGFVRTPLTDKNDFPMPFLMEPEDAADRIAEGLARGKFEISFPRRFIWWLKLGQCLPYALYFRLTRRLLQ